MDIVLRGIVVFVFLFVLVRVMGKRELSSLEPFDLILLIILGDAVQQGLTQDDYSLTGALLAVGTIAILQIATSWLNFRIPRLRPILDGEPVVVLQDGEPILRNMRRERLTIDDLAEAARREGIGTLDDVAWAVMETSGTISFIKKSDA
ncbi:MAG TPA: YetF domain-containing protein [Gaiellaceae bacterium]